MHETVTICEENLLLLPEKAIFWKKKKILLLADLHLGKINHFRRSGIAVPHTPNSNNLERLIDLIHAHRPDRVLFLGDLFHSDYNQEWEAFGQTRNYFPEISFELVDGNHDVMSDYQYLKHNLIRHKDGLHLYPFYFTHIPEEHPPTDHFNLAGHIHPGVRLAGKGRQRLTLPCFYFSNTQGLLPAFGAFTGLYKLHPTPTDQIFVITKTQVLKCPPQPTRKGE